jgi:uncharacterized protein YjbJ (UPF0337 family)
LGPSAACRSRPIGAEFLSSDAASQAAENFWEPWCKPAVGNQKFPSNEDFPMDENRIAGAAKNVGGKIEEGFGRATGDAKTRAAGQARQVEGDLQDLYGRAKDTAANVAATVRGGASDVEDIIRSTIETRPYTTAFVALCLGWFLGRMGRRDAY